jgi:hypothetical protein
MLSCLEFVKNGRLIDGVFTGMLPGTLNIIKMKGNRMKKELCKYFIFALIGIMPNVLAGYSVLDWQWWAVFFPFMIGVNLRDYAHTLD